MAAGSMEGSQVLRRHCEPDENHSQPAPRLCEADQCGHPSCVSESFCAAMLVQCNVSCKHHDIRLESSFVDAASRKPRNRMSRWDISFLGVTRVILNNSQQGILRSFSGISVHTQRVKSKKRVTTGGFFKKWLAFLWYGESQRARKAI